MSVPSAAAVNRLIVANIKRARRKVGLDQSRFALALDIPKWRLCEIEAGAEVFGPDLIKRAAEVLHLEIRDLFADPPNARAA